MRIAVLTVPFCKFDDRPLQALKESRCPLYVNDSGKKFTKERLLHLLDNFKPEVIINDTERYDKGVLDRARFLRMLSNTGVGYDAIDVEECGKRGIVVTNTPDAPSHAVADITVGQIIAMMRKPPQIDRDLRNDQWNRYIGRELRSCLVGIIGFGRIGSLVAERLRGFGCEIWVNDLLPIKLDPYTHYTGHKITIADKTQIYRHCDIITLHVPLTEKTYDMIGLKELNMMKNNVRLLNFSRGGIINEYMLFHWLKVNKKACAAIDTFENEAYKGKLRELGNTYLTAHCGSCTQGARYAMEMTAVNQALAFMRGEEVENRIV